MLLVFLPFGLAWHSELTNALLGDENAKRARAAQAEGAEHWEEVGVGIGPEGQPYAMGIARGKAYEHIQPGLFLVASANVKGGIFAESVNLVIHHDANGSLALMVVGQVWWLRKALLKLAVSRVLPIEYGTVACLSVLGSVILFQEGVYVPDNFGWGIASGIALIMLGCGQVGSRYSPWPACCGLFPAAKRTLKMPAEVVLQNAAPRQVSRVVDDEDQVVVSVEQV